MHAPSGLGAPLQTMLAAGSETGDAFPTGARKLPPEVSLVSPPFPLGLCLCGFLPAKPARGRQGCLDPKIRMSLRSF